ILDEVTYAYEPRFTKPLDGDVEDVERLRELFELWRDEEWRTWAARVAIVEGVRLFHARLFDLQHQLDMNSATEELVWGHRIMEFDVGEQKVRYPLLATPVAIEYDADTSLITVVPQGPTRLQTDPLTGVAERFMGQLVELAGPGGHVDVDVWDQTDRRELFER